MPSQELARSHYEQITLLVSSIDSNLSSLSRYSISAASSDILMKSRASLRLLQEEAEMLWLSSCDKELARPHTPIFPSTPIVHARGMRCSKAMM